MRQTARCCWGFAWSSPARWDPVERDIVLGHQVSRDAVSPAQAEVYALWPSGLLRSVRPPAHYFFAEETILRAAWVLLTPGTQGT